MSEDLTEFFLESSVRVRYLHSDVDTVERVEIIRDLRLGEFDVLVGINLLREGLDLPEVALVAILDADKEGFLRSEGSLIQTIGRAARNISGRALLYADSITGSMRRAIEETDRRRAVQEKYNVEHGITPKGIVKEVTDIMEGAQSGSGIKKRSAKAEIKDFAKYSGLDKKELFKQCAALEDKMLKHARDLEFEEAAAIRDEIVKIKSTFLEIPKSIHRDS